MGRGQGRTRAASLVSRRLSEYGRASAAAGARGISRSERASRQAAADRAESRLRDAQANLRRLSGGS